MDTAPNDFASNIFYGFDIQDAESLDFLKSLITSRTTPVDEIRELWQLALFRGQEEWDMTFSCAASLHARAMRDVGPEGNPGFLAYLTFVCAEEQEKEQFLTKHNLKGGTKKENQKQQRARRRATSKFWQDDKLAGETARGTQRKKAEVGVKRNSSVEDEHMPTAIQQTDESTSTFETFLQDLGHTPEVERSPSYSPLTSPSLSPSCSPQPSPQLGPHRSLISPSRAYRKSPFFTTIETPKKPRRKFPVMLTLITAYS